MDLFRLFGRQQAIRGLSRNQPDVQFLCREREGASTGAQEPRFGPQLFKELTGHKFGAGQLCRGQEVLQGALLSDRLDVEAAPVVAVI